MVSNQVSGYKTKPLIDLSQDQTEQNKESPDKRWNNADFREMCNGYKIQYFFQVFFYLLTCA